MVDGDDAYRITDTATDTRVATCYAEANAQLMVRALNTLDDSATAPIRILPSDVVRLRSGGPLMTVGHLAAAAGRHVDPAIMPPSAGCFWINDDGGPASALFPLPALERIADKMPDLFTAALALWGDQADIDGNASGYDHPFDYCQTSAEEAIINAFGVALAAMDGKPRKFIRQDDR